MPTDEGFEDAVDLHRLISSDSVARLEENLVGRISPEAIHVYLKAESSAVTVGYLLVELDRETRRASNFLRAPTPREGRVSPHGPRAFGVLKADPGSLDILLTAFDEIANVLLSQPVQLIITLSWFWDRRPISWGLARPHRVRSVQEIWAELNESARAAIQQDHGVETELLFIWPGFLRARFKSTPERRSQKPGRTQQR